jgi:hypothetical protein
VSSADEILEQIRHARTDASVSDCAMRWSPEPGPGPVPVVPFTGRDAARAIVVRRLVDEHELAPEEARSAVRAVETGQPTEHHQLVTQAAQTAAAETARQLAELFSAFVRALQPVAEAAASVLRQLDAALRAAGHASSSGKPGRRRGRPAWQSPYGPPPRRKQ